MAFNPNSAFHRTVQEMASQVQSHYEREAYRKSRKDTINVEKQDLEEWYAALEDLRGLRLPQGVDHLDTALGDLRDSIYRYLR